MDCIKDKLNLITNEKVLRLSYKTKTIFHHVIQHRDANLHGNLLYLFNTNWFTKPQTATTLSRLTLIIKVV